MSDAETFSSAWVAAWNARAIDQIMDHYAEEVEFTSPRAQKLVPESGGVIRGKAALRAYLSKAIAASPNLRFHIVSVMETVNGATILYDNHRAERVTETMLWNEHREVTRSIVAYADAARRTVHCMVARVPATGVDAFLRYESGVLPILREYGARLVRRLRTGDGLTEVHLVEEDEDGAIDAYRGDARREALRPLLDESGATVEVWRTRDVSLIE